MADYDFDAFLAAQEGKGREALLQALEFETIRIDYKLAGKKRALARAAGAEPYRRRLADAARWLRTGRPPTSLSEAAGAVLVSVCGRDEQPR